VVKCLQNLRDAFRTPIIASDYFSAADHGIGLKRCVDAFTEEDWKLFEDLDSYKKFRHELEQEMNVSRSFSCRREWIDINLLVLARCDAQRIRLAETLSTAVSREHVEEAIEEALDC